MGKIETWSPQRMLEVQFKKQLKKPYIKNVKLYPTDIDFGNIASPGEICVVKIDRTDSGSYYFTNTRIFFFRDNIEFVLDYNDIVRMHWIIDSSDLRLKSRLKRTHFDRLILELNTGQKIALDKLDQAYTVLHFFFRWLTHKRLPKSSVNDIK